jgi:hypothetical protein
MSNKRGANLGFTLAKTLISRNDDLIRLADAVFVLRISASGKLDLLSAFLHTVP